MPVLLEIVRSGSGQVANGGGVDSATKSQAIGVFRQCIQTLFMLKEEYPEGTKLTMEEIVPNWLSVFNDVLSTDVSVEVNQPGSDWQGLSIRNEIFRTLITLQASFPSVLRSNLSSYISLSTQHLQALLPTFYTYYLSSSPDAPDPPSIGGGTGSNDEGQDIGVVELACSIVDLLTGMSRVRGVRKFFVLDGQGSGGEREEKPTELLEGLIYLLVCYTQITKEDVSVARDLRTLVPSFGPDLATRVDRDRDNSRRLTKEPG